jgi:uncharacterized protein YutE (UPF0331/DUF86 family)
MVNRSLLSSKLVELSDRVARIREHRSANAEELKANRDAFEVVAFNLMLAVQSCCDIASHLIADEHWPAAKNLAEGFSRLEERGVVDAPLAESLRKAVGLRNVVAHGYAGIDAEAVHAAASRGLADLERFAQVVASWAAGQPETP